MTAAGPQSPPQEKPAPAPRRRWVWKAVLAAAVLTAAILAWRVGPLRRHVLRPAALALVALLERTRDMGPWGPVAFAGLQAAGIVLLVSSSVSLVVAGFLFGMAVGLPAATAGNTLGAVAAFALARTLLHNWAERHLAGHPLLLELDRVVGQKGLRAVALTRVTPLPSVLLNYGFGLTRVRFGPYLLGTILGMIPRSVLYVYLGSLARTAVKTAAEAVQFRARHPALMWAYFAIGTAVALGLAVFMARLARKALNRTTREGLRD